MHTIQTNKNCVSRAQILAAYAPTIQSDASATLARTPMMMRLPINKKAPSATLQRVRAKKLHAPMAAHAGAAAAMMGAAVAVGLHGMLGVTTTTVTMLYSAITPVALVGAQMVLAQREALAWRLDAHGPLALDTML